MKHLDYAFDGVWSSIRRKKFSLACCDCGLVHVVNFRIDKKNNLQIQFFRDIKETRIRRRTIKHIKK